MADSSDGSSDGERLLIETRRAGHVNLTEFRLSFCEGRIRDTEVFLAQPREFDVSWAGIRSWHDKCWRQAKDGVGIQHTVFGRVVQARASKGVVEITDWTRFNMLTEYRVCGSAADLLKGEHGAHGRAAVR